MKLLWYLLLVIFVTFSCKEGAEDSIPNVRNVDIETRLIRFDQELMNLDTLHLQRDLQKLSDRYPALYPLYFERILRINNPDVRNHQFLQEMDLFLKDQGVRYMLRAIDSVFGDFSSLEKDFEQAFRYLKYYFPSQQVPDVYTLFSEYSISNFIFTDEQGEDALGVGLDFFLGSDYPYQQIVPNNTAFSRYLTRSFDKEHLVRKSLVPWIEDKLPRPKIKLLDKMIYEGKKLYILKKLLPHTPDSVIFVYSQKDLDFCLENEKQIWSFFLDDGLIYSVEPFQINKYIHPAPHSSGMPQGAPGRTGSFIGYQIVRQYMRRHPDISLTELIHQQDAQQLLEASKYKPRN